MPRVLAGVRFVGEVLGAIDGDSPAGGGRWHAVSKYGSPSCGKRLLRRVERAPARDFQVVGSDQRAAVRPRRLVGPAFNQRKPRAVAKTPIGNQDALGRVRATRHVPTTGGARSHLRQWAASDTDRPLPNDGSSSSKAISMAPGPTYNQATVAPGRSAPVAPASSADLRQSTRRCSRQRSWRRRGSPRRRRRQYARSHSSRPGPGCWSAAGLDPRRAQGGHSPAGPHADRSPGAARAATVDRSADRRAGVERAGGPGRRSAATFHPALVDFTGLPASVARATVPGLLLPAHAAHARAGPDRWPTRAARGRLPPDPIGVQDALLAREHRFGALLQTTAAD